MSKTAHPLALLAPENVHQMAGTEALAGAVDARKRHARRFRCIHPFRRIDAVIAVAAVTLMRLAEITQQ